MTVVKWLHICLIFVGIVAVLVTIQIYNLVGSLEENSASRHAKTNPNERNIFLSVICLTYNNSDILDAMLKSFTKMKLPWSIELIIMDNGCFSSTLSVTDSYKIKFRQISNIHFEYVPLCVNLHYSVANNLGVYRYSSPRSEWVLFLNDDIIPHDHSLLWNFNYQLSLLKSFNNAHRIGAIGCRLLYPNHRVNEAGSMIFSNGKTMNFLGYSSFCITHDYIINNCIK